MDRELQASAFGSAFPQAINEEALRNIALDNTKWRATRDRLMQFHIEHHVASDVGVDDAELQAIGLKIAGHELVKLKTQDVKDGEVDSSSAVREEWCFRVRKGEVNYKHYLKVTSELMGDCQDAYLQLVSGHWVPWALDAYMQYYLKGDTQALDAVDSSIERCVHAVLHEWAAMGREFMRQSVLKKA